MNILIEDMLVDSIIWLMCLLCPLVIEAFCQFHVFKPGPYKESGRLSLVEGRP